MAIYVADASVVIQYAINQEYTAAAKALIVRMCRREDELLIPEFCLLECTNVLWKEVRFQGLPENQAAVITHELQMLAFRVVPVRDLLPRALQIGLACRLAVYDALYIALALQQDCPLITVDLRQQEGALKSGGVLKAIADFLPES